MKHDWDYTIEVKRGKRVDLNGAKCVIEILEQGASCYIMVKRSCENVRPTCLRTSRVEEIECDPLTGVITVETQNSTYVFTPIGGETNDLLG